MEWSSIEGGSDTALVEKLGADRHQKIQDGGISFANSADHAEAHQQMKSAGFNRVSNKNRTDSQKLGRSTAHISIKFKESQYAHPSGATASVRTKTSRYGGGQITYFNIINPRIAS